MFEQLEREHGVAVLWAWVKDWVQNERECDDDERMPLEEYLLMRAGNAD